MLFLTCVQYRFLVECAGYQVGSVLVVVIIFVIVSRFVFFGSGWGCVRAQRLG